MIILAIETSCDDTCAAIIKNGKIISNIVISQSKIHNEYGGVYPELAARMHCNNIDNAIKKALIESKITIDNITHVAYTKEPGLVGSLHIGAVAAQTISKSLNVKLLPINHIESHVKCISYDNKIEYPAIGVIISGGHSSVYYIENMSNYKIIGETKDDAVGEAIDKIAKYLNLGYPGGPIIDKLAKTGNIVFDLPIFNNKNEISFSYSGFKQATKKILDKNNNFNINDICATVQHYAFKQVENNISKSLLKFNNIKSILIGGGVSANSYLRKIYPLIFSELNVFFPKKTLSTDNAAMIGYNAYLKILENKNKI